MTEFAGPANTKPVSPAITIDPYLERIAANSRAGRDDRNVPADSVDALRDSGLFRSFVPKNLGGLGVTPQEWLRTLIKVAEHDMSTAWIAGIISVHPYQIALMDERAQKEVYGENSDTAVSSSYNPFGARTRVVEGGVMLHGRWGWSSGSAYCDWVLLGAIVEGEQLLQTLLVPRKDYVIEDTWRTMGLQGTGSNDIVIEEPVFVPSYRIHKQMDGYNCVNDQPERFYNLPWAQIFAATVAAPTIGAARHALKLFLSKIKTSSTDPTKMMSDPDILRRVAEATALIDDAEATLLRNFDAMMTLIENGNKIPLSDRAKYRYQTGMIVTRMMNAVDMIFDVAGGRSVFLGADIQDIWHDIHIARAHVANNPVPLARNYGNMLLGGDNQDFFI